MVECVMRICYYQVSNVVVYVVSHIHFHTTQIVYNRIPKALKLGHLCERRVSVSTNRHAGALTRKVLETMAAPQATNTKLKRCTSPNPPSSPNKSTVPPGKSPCLLTAAQSTACAPCSTAFPATPTADMTQPWAPANLPILTHAAMNAVRPKLDGIGIPVKYLTDPDPPFGISATVALNRARRASPHEAKKRSERMSSGRRSPRV